MRICGYVDMWICGYVDMWICGYADMWICGYAGGVCEKAHPSMVSAPGANVSKNAKRRIARFSVTTCVVAARQQIKVAL
eukprot:3607592-Pyramimonas_sp.AAC.1